MIKIAVNAVDAKLMNPSKDIVEKVSALLSYESKSGSFIETCTFYDFSLNTFPAGFVGLVTNFLQSQGVGCSLIRKPLPEPLGPERPEVDALGYSDTYSYQPETVDRLVRYGQIIAQVATGGGKSRIAKMAVMRIGRPCLFITTRSTLMHQMRRGFTGLTKEHVGVLGDGEWNPSAMINVGMVQTLISRLDGTPEQKDEVIRLLESFEFVILEEAHEAGASGYYTLMRLCKNAHYRLALTATPFMKTDQGANMRLMAASGPVAIRITEKELIEKGILAKPFFKYIEPGKPDKLARATNYKRAYELGIVESVPRNSAILRECAMAKKHGLTVMVLVKHKKHGLLLESAMKKMGIRCQFIFGTHSSEERDAALKRLDKRTIDVLIGSTILDVGVDVPSVGMAILAGGDKAEVALRQRIGRVLRRKKTGPNVSYIVDFADSHNKHLRNHYLQRRAFVEATPGFAENIIPDGQGFDFHQFKATK